MKQLSGRDLALMVLRAVEEKDAFANLALSRIMERYQPEKIERAFATELAYGVLRRRNALDFVLGRFLKKPLGSHTIILRNILRLGVYQLLFMKKVPPSAACNESAEMARRYGHKGAVKLVNGVLRNVARLGDDIGYPAYEENPAQYLIWEESHPEWLVHYWLGFLHLEEVYDMCLSNNMTPPTTIRTNTLRLTRDQLMERLLKEGLTVKAANYAPEGLRINEYFSIDRINAFKDGLFLVQDESSILAGWALSPVKGAKVLDICSAPGGKTTHLAALMGNSGEILAVDIHPHKLKLVEDNCRRLGIEIVRTMAADATNLGDDLREWADYILVDAPCSGLGVLRRRPDARWRKTESQPAEMARLQKDILDSAAKCLKPGGVLVYSTCTVSREENMEQMNDFLSRHKEFTSESLSPYLSVASANSTSMPGIPAYGVRGSLEAGYVQILPNLHDMDGFFFSRMRKKDKNE